MHEMEEEVHHMMPLGNQPGGLTHILNGQSDVINEYSGVSEEESPS